MTDELKGASTEAPASEIAPEATTEGQRQVTPAPKAEEMLALPQKSSLPKRFMAAFKPVSSHQVLPARQRQIFTVPRVEITAEVLRQMSQEVMSQSHQETSWGLYGIRDMENRVIICGILPPNHSVHRSFGNTVFGSPDYGEEIRWLKASYGLRKKLDLAPQDTELDFLFKGHSHHRLGLRRYSSVDIASIQDAVVNMGMEVAIGPLANIDRSNSDAGIHPSGNFGSITVQTGYSVTFHFYYLSRWMVEQGMREPELIAPYVRQEKLDYVPPSCWKFKQRDFFVTQQSRLTSHGCQVTETWAGQKDGSLRLILGLTHPNWVGQLKISTPHDFPESPAVFILPDGSRQPFDPPKSGHTPNSYDLLTAVKTLETTGGLLPHATVPNPGSSRPEPS